MVSFDATALFTIVPTREATEVVKEKLIQDTTLLKQNKNEYQPNNETFIKFTIEKEQPTSIQRYKNTHRP